MTRELLAIGAGTLLSIALTLAAHLGLYKRLPDEANYTIGVLCIGIGFSLSAALLDAGIEWLASAACAIGSGAVVVVARWARRETQQRSIQRANAERVMRLAEHDDATVSGRFDHRNN